ncbi:MAG TPA: hypothetical protein VLN49_11695 [Gemmatimonadaceae bacterium]|nr:hypothetical protein [Gemmatimonadaceae bacterium]
MNRGLMLLGACVIAIGAPRPSVAQFGSPEVSVTATLTKLGAKAATTNIPSDLELGRSVTASLVSVEKIEQYGIKGMHEGARVTVTRVAPDRIRVEADEMEPVSAKSVVTLRIGTDGTLAPVAEHVSAKAPPER